MNNDKHREYQLFKKYTERLYGGKELLKSYDLDTYGTWQIKGEDKNCDLGGPHHEPDLGLFKGTLEDCIKYAISLPRFWTWGGGGRILAVSIMESKKEEVRLFLEEGIKEKALAKLTDEEKEVLGLS